MKNFQKWFLYFVLLTLLLIGCGKRTIDTMDTTQLDDSSSSPRLNDSSAEAIPVEKDGIIGSLPVGRTICGMQEFEEDAPYQNIFMLNNVSRYIVVTLSNQDTMVFTLPKDQYISDFLKILLADLDQDGYEEVIAYCVQSKTNQGILHILNIATGMLMETPFMAAPASNDDATPKAQSVGGVNYRVLSYDSRHFRLKSASPLYETIGSLSASYIHDRNYSIDTALSKDDYLLPNDELNETEIGTVMGISGSSTDGFGIEIRNGIPCVTIRQQVLGSWGNGYWLGTIDSVLSWKTDGTFDITEAIFQEATADTVDRWAFDSSSPYEAITIERYPDDLLPVWWSQFVVITRDQQEIAFLVPGEMKVLAFDRVITSDFNGDGSVDIAVSYSPIAYTSGVCVLDVQNGFLSFPSLADPEFSLDSPDAFPPGLPYEVVSGGDDTLTLSCNKLNLTVTIPLTLEELAASQDLSILDSTGTLTAKEYLRPYRQPKGTPIQGGSGASYVDYQSLEAVTIDNRQCLRFRQPILGAWGQNDCLGYVDSVLTWDAQGNYEVIQANYVPKKPLS
jgi:hypothetical protein